IACHITSPAKIARNSSTTSGRLTAGSIAEDGIDSRQQIGLPAATPVWDDRRVKSMRLPVGDGVILAIDQGSSSTRCIAFDAGLKPLASTVSPVATLRPAAGLVEHDAGELLSGTLAALSRTREAVSSRPVAAIGIADQTETFVLWEAESGRAVTPVVSWQDQRAAELCRSLEGRPEAASLAAVTGLSLDPTFSAPKLAWLFERDPPLARRAERGELRFGDVACWLAWQLSDG